MASNADKWAGKLVVAGLERPWWNTANTEAVARIELAGVLAFDVHVVRGKSGKPFVTTPSSRKGEEWAPVLTLTDGGLKEAVTAATLEAFATWSPPAANGEDGLPF